MKVLTAILGTWMLICTVLLIERTEPTRAATVTASTLAVGMARTSNNKGYWIATQDGAVYSFGNAVFHGGANQFKHSGTIVGLVTTSTDGGYWEVGSDGGVYAFGNARFYGSMGGQSINAPITGSARTPTNGGYWLVGADGGVYAFGDARFYGSMGGQSINAPISGMVASSTGQGYWLVGRDGGVYAFGDARFYGSMGGQHLNAPIVGLDRTSANGGYWLIGADGGIFSFGNAGFHGSMGGQHLNTPIVGLAATSDNGGYWGVAGDGGIFAFGNAQYYGNITVTPPPKTSATLWGVDTASNITPQFLGQIESNFGTPMFIGRYLDGKPRCCQLLNASEAAYIHSQNIRILPIMSDFVNDTTYSTGASLANDAIVKAHALGISTKTVIIADIENRSSVDAGFIEGWYTMISSAGYTPGYYLNPYPGSSRFSSAFCSAVSSNLAIGNSIMYVTEPNKGRTPQSSAPHFGPASVICSGHTTGQTLAWQYGIKKNNPINVDTDELQSSVPLW